MSEMRKLRHGRAMSPLRRSLALKPSAGTVMPAEVQVEQAARAANSSSATKPDSVMVMVMVMATGTEREMATERAMGTVRESE
jgi:hypothetical protein